MASANAPIEASNKHLAVYRNKDEGVLANIGDPSQAERTREEQTRAFPHMLQQPPRPKRYAPTHPR